MGFFKRAIILAAAVIAIGVALWLSLAMFAFLMIAGGLAVIGYAAREYLIAKGILNPRPGVPMDMSDARVTVIETEYKQIDSD